MPFHDGNKVSIHKRPLDGSKPDETLYEGDKFLGQRCKTGRRIGNYLSVDLEKNDLIYKIWILPLIGKREPFLSAASSTAAADAETIRRTFFSGWAAGLSYFPTSPGVRKSTWCRFSRMA